MRDDREMMSADEFATLRMTVPFHQRGDYFKAMRQRWREKFPDIGENSLIICSCGSGHKKGWWKPTCIGCKNQYP